MTDEINRKLRKRTVWVSQSAMKESKRASGGVQERECKRESAREKVQVRECK